MTEPIGTKPEGVMILYVECQQCGHERAFDEEAELGDRPRRNFVCSKCGGRIGKTTRVWTPGANKKR